MEIVVLLISFGAVVSVVLSQSTTSSSTSTSTSSELPDGLFLGKVVRLVVPEVDAAMLEQEEGSDDRRRMVLEPVTVGRSIRRRRDPPPSVATKVDSAVRSFTQLEGDRFQLNDGVGSSAVLLHRLDAIPIHQRKEETVQTIAPRPAASGANKKSVPTSAKKDKSPIVENDEDKSGEEEALLFKKRRTMNQISRIQDVIRQVDNSNGGLFTMNQAPQSRAAGEPYYYPSSFYSDREWDRRVPQSIQARNQGGYGGTHDGNYQQNEGGYGGATNRDRTNYGSSLNLIRSSAYNDNGGEAYGGNNGDRGRGGRSIFDPLNEATTDYNNRRRGNQQQQESFGSFDPRNDPRRNTAYGRFDPDGFLISSAGGRGISRPSSSSTIRGDQYQQQQQQQQQQLQGGRRIVGGDYNRHQLIGGQRVVTDRFGQRVVANRRGVNNDNNRFVTPRPFISSRSFATRRPQLPQYNNNNNNNRNGDYGRQQGGGGNGYRQQNGGGDAFINPFSDSLVSAGGQQLLSVDSLYMTFGYCPEIMEPKLQHPERHNEELLDNCVTLLHRMDHIDDPTDFARRLMQKTFEMYCCEVYRPSNGGVANNIGLQNPNNRFLMTGNRKNFGEQFGNRGRTGSFSGGGRRTIINNKNNNRFGTRGTQTSDGFVPSNNNIRNTDGSRRNRVSGGVDPRRRIGQNGNRNSGGFGIAAGVGGNALRSLRGVRNSKAEGNGWIRRRTVEKDNNIRSSEKSKETTPAVPASINISNTPNPPAQSEELPINSSSSSSSSSSSPIIHDDLNQRQPDQPKSTRRRSIVGTNDPFEIKNPLN